MIFALFFACASPLEEKANGLVYEGMSSNQLEEILGNPKAINKRGEIFDAETMKMISVQEWIYDKRTVLLINDTVKNPRVNLNEVD